MNNEYIRREDAIDAFNRIKNTLKNPETAHYDTLMFYEIEDVLEDVEPADVVQVVRCKDCIHNNACYIQYSAQAGDNFFCGFGETEKDVREDVYE